MLTISACIVAYCDYEEVCAAVRSILHFTPRRILHCTSLIMPAPTAGKQLADTDWAPRAGALPAGERRLWPRHNAVLGKLHSSVFYLKP